MLGDVLQGALLLLVGLLSVGGGEGGLLVDLGVLVIGDRERASSDISGSFLDIVERLVQPTRRQLEDFLWPHFFFLLRA